MAQTIKLKTKLIHALTAYSPDTVLDLEEVEMDQATAQWLVDHGKAEWINTPTGKSRKNAQTGLTEALQEDKTHE